ncbi:MAG: SpoIIE family protein phosphatase [Treponema sp.]|nr:SpoIIE family protein phosphatase [Treponema sp.]
MVRAHRELRVIRQGIRAFVEGPLPRLPPKRKVRPRFWKAKPLLEADLLAGRDVQKQFFPLETGADGKKLTTGSLEDSNTQIFGYYEARGVSGDYFDYKKLDDRWFGIIKCDVSGKGIPAALISVEVATLFLDYFDRWTYQTHGVNLSPLVSRINDLIESHGFNSRFAAFTLCLFDSLEGKLYFCNAGDSAIHVYDYGAGKTKTFAVPAAPAAGVFPNEIITSQGGFPVSTLRLAAGDVLFLYTDGIEDSRRRVRNRLFRAGLELEDFGVGRIMAVITAVFSRSSYFLQKQQNPVADEILEFDFSRCSGSAEDAILALSAVEKIFRIYKPPLTTAFDKVRVDRKTDAFLKLHFKQYSDYCVWQEDCPETPEYLNYTNVKSDPQFDDMALVAVKKK